MLSIYETLLGEAYKKMHPKLQKRYCLTDQSGFIGKGIMDSITGGNFVVRQFLRLGVRFRLFFSERGKDIPFTIVNTVIKNEQGQQIVEWRRTFDFQNVSRHFDAVMYLDDYKQEIIDDFGMPSVMTSTLAFHVDECGAVHITSKKQWLQMFGKRISLPKCLYGVAHIVEAFDDENDCFLISVHVRNPLVGTVFSYNGTFRECDSL
ncbi:DUF4166 domain-containing protein [Bacillus sp. JJ722]|uniref:DUF4166 domain-containing protein n=1 Tax=Bacillus sp. JJ722 TaxID=3122973 RepID=UPI003000A6B5